MTTGTAIFLSVVAICITGIINTWIEERGRKW